MIVIKLFLNFCLYFYLGLITVITIIPKTIIDLLFNKKKKKKIILRRKKFIHDSVVLGLTLLTYLICVFLISRWTVQKLKINYLANSIIENTEIIEKEEENIVITNTIEIPQEEVNQTPQNTQTYYPNDYWKYTNVNFMEVNLPELQKKNPDTVAWLKINNTNVNYPVTQTTDNQYYLNHSFNKSKNSNGWIYGDYRNDFENFKSNTIIYGHNLTNRSMFGSLTWTLKESWYKNSDNLNIKLSTNNSNTVWRIFSIYLTDVESYYLRTIFASDTDYQTFLNEMKSRSKYNFGEEVTTNDKILTLSTCDDSGTKRLVIQAKMIKIEYK